LESEVYRDVIGPDIDSMIFSISGYKTNEGFWASGNIADRRLDTDTLKYLSGYQAALVELSMKFKYYIRQGELSLKQETNQQEQLVGMEDDL